MSLTVTKQEILVISLTDFFMLLHDVIMTSCCYQRYTECLVTTFFPGGQCTRHTAASMCRPNSWTAASRNAKLFRAQPAASKQPRCQSGGLLNRSCYAASCLPPTDPSCGWIETAAHPCRHAALNSRFLTRILNDIERVHVLKEDTSSTAACELAM